MHRQGLEFPSVECRSPECSTLLVHAWGYSGTSKLLPACGIDQAAHLSKAACQKTQYLDRLVLGSVLIQIQHSIDQYRFNAATPGKGDVDHKLVTACFLACISHHHQLCCKTSTKYCSKKPCQTAGSGSTTGASKSPLACCAELPPPSYPLMVALGFLLLSYHCLAWQCHFAMCRNETSKQLC